MLSTRSLAWLDSSHKLYDHCKFLYVGLSVSQLRFSPPHYSTQHHFLSLIPVPCHFETVCTSLRALVGEQVCGSVLLNPVLLFFSCPPPLILKPCYSLHVGTWNLRVWESNKATAVVPRTGGAAKLFSRPHMQRLDWPPWGLTCLIFPFASAHFSLL